GRWPAQIPVSAQHQNLHRHPPRFVMPVRLCRAFFNVPSAFSQPIRSRHSLRKLRRRDNVLLVSIVAGG
ncbi:MAG TPA: hypothetical protein VGI00_00720, partial [Streptosporangiaceae bacterium]